MQLLTEYLGNAHVSLCEAISLVGLALYAESEDSSYEDDKLAEIAHLATLVWDLLPDNSLTLPFLQIVLNTGVADIPI